MRCVCRSGGVRMYRPESAVLHCISCCGCISARNGHVVAFWSSSLAALCVFLGCIIFSALWPAAQMNTRGHEFANGCVDVVAAMHW